MERQPRTNENTLKLLEKTDLVIYTYKVETNFKHKTYWSSEYLNDREDKDYIYDYIEECKYDLGKGIYCYRISDKTKKPTLVGVITIEEIIFY